MKLTSSTESICDIWQYKYEKYISFVYQKLNRDSKFFNNI